MCAKCFSEKEDKLAWFFEAPFLTSHYLSDLLARSMETFDREREKGMVIL